MGLISNIDSLGALKLAKDLSPHLIVMKSVFDELDQTTTSDGDALVSKVVASYVMV